MNYRLIIRFLVLLTALSACQRDPYGNDPASEPQLGISLELPGAPMTRGEAGDVSATSAECAVHSLQAWIFTSDEPHEKIGTLNLTGADLPTPGSIRRYFIPVSREFARALPDVDIFALANAAAIGCTLDDDASWQDLQDSVFGDPWYGVSSPTRTVPQNGLPISGMGTHLAITGEAPVLTTQTVRMVRAVSKIRFVFARTTDAQEEKTMSVDKIYLDSEMIPLQEHVFSEGPYSIAPQGYYSGSMKLEELPPVLENDTPEKLVYAGQGAQNYEQLIDDAIAAGTLTDAGTVYLRESDRRLRGTIHYTINNAPGSKSFLMEEAGDFARNHSWTVYGYFLSGRNLQLTTNVIPWDYNRHVIDFNTRGVQATQLNLDDTTFESISTTEEIDGEMKDITIVHLLPGGVAARGTFNITAPQGGKLMITPQGPASYFIVTPSMVDINGANGGKVELSVRRNPEATGNLSGEYITLSFSVELGDRDMDANTEILNDAIYRFML